MLASELSFSNPLAITPGAENGNNNTEITATFIKGAGDAGAINGSTTAIQYTRLTLANSYPTANRTIDITDADTLTSVKAKIADTQRLVPEEFTLSSESLPSASSTGAMPIDAIANSKLYVPEQLVLTLNNTSVGAPYAGTFLITGDGQDDGSTDIRNLQSGAALTVHGNARFRTNNFKYGTGSLYLDGSGDYVTFPHTEIGDLLSGDFTVEMWVYQQAIPQYGTVFAQWSQQSPQSIYGGILFYLANGYPEFYHRAVSVAGPVVAGPSPVPLQQWTHLAVTRAGSVFRMFVNGVKVSEATSAATAAPNTTVRMSIGNYYNTAGNIGAVSDFNGYLDEIGIYKGVARYTADFTPARL